MSKKLIGSVAADDAAFCAIEIDVVLLDSEKRRKYIHEQTEQGWLDEHPYMTSTVTHEPLSVAVQWEHNCSNSGLIFLTQKQAVRLARILLDASLEEPAAHSKPKL